MKAINANNISKLTKEEKENIFLSIFAEPLEPVDLTPEEIEEQKAIEECWRYHPPGEFNPLQY